MNIGVLASHNGSNLQAIIDASESGMINSKVCLVISNNSRSGALERAKNHHIPFLHLSSKTNPENLDDAILDALLEYNCEMIFLAGYMKKLGTKTLEKFQGKILNTHPSLLPKYGGEGMYGINVHQAVIENSDTESGVSIHLVDQNYDTGKIIAQVKVPVIAEDTPESLCERVMNREREFVVETIGKIERKEVILQEYTSAN